MRYCPKCQTLVEAEEECPSCGNRKLREVRPNDPVLLYTTDETKCSMIRAAFDESGIPHEERMCGAGAPPALLYGKTPGALYRIFVPFGEVDHCKEILGAMGMLEGTDPAKRISGREPAEADPAKMSPRKRVLVRILSAAAFLLIVWGVVELADEFIAFLKSAFG